MVWKSPDFGLKTSVPMRSAGSKSGVNCTGRSLDGWRASSRPASWPDHALEQEVPVGQQAEQEAIEQVFLPDDDATHRGLQGAESSGCFPGRHG